LSPPEDAKHHTINSLAHSTIAQYHCNIRASYVGSDRPASPGAPSHLQLILNSTAQVHASIASRSPRTPDTDRIYSLILDRQEIRGKSQDGLRQSLQSLPSQQVGLIRVLAEGFHERPGGKGEDEQPRCPVVRVQQKPREINWINKLGTRANLE
jgi:hypothetical protein